MKISVTIQPDLPANVRRLITWEHPTAIQDGYNVWDRLINGEVVGQFCMCPVYVTDANNVWAGTWSSNTLSTLLTNSQIRQIAKLQKADAFSIKQKMGWLTNGGNGRWGAPLRCSGDYLVTTDARMIATVYAGQLVKLTGETINRAITIQGRTNIEKLHRIVTYPPAQWSTPEATQIVTAVDKNNTHTENTKGKIVLPIYFGDRRAWVLDRWLV